jgi:hypothetical protein
VWFLHIGLRLFGLWILLARPEVDAHVQHNPTHFWLVALVALINVAIASRISAEAARRADARLLLVVTGFSGQTTAALIRHVARLEPLGEVDVKGRTEPVHTYRLVGSTSRVGRYLRVQSPPTKPKKSSFQRSAASKCGP